MSREAHVRFWEGLGVRFPRPTQHGPNWTADVVLEEDTASPSLRGKAPLVLSWLRVLAYNLLALVRTHLPIRDKRPQSFARTMEVLYQGLLGLAVLPESLAPLA